MSLRRNAICVDYRMGPSSGVMIARRIITSPARGSMVSSLALRYNQSVYFAYCSGPRSYSFKVKSNHREVTSFKGETGSMVAIILCKDHDKSRRDIYDICEVDDSGEVRCPFSQTSCRLVTDSLPDGIAGLLPHLQAGSCVSSSRSVAQGPSPRPNHQFAG